MNLFITRFTVAFNSAAAGWYATMDEPCWPLFALHSAAALFGLWCLRDIQRKN